MVHRELSPRLDCCIVCQDPESVEELHVPGKWKEPEFKQQLWNCYRLRSLKEIDNDGLNKTFSKKGNLCKTFFNAMCQFNRGEYFNSKIVWHYSCLRDVTSALFVGPQLQLRQYNLGFDDKKSRKIPQKMITPWLELAGLDLTMPSKEFESLPVSSEAWRNSFPSSVNICNIDDCRPEAQTCTKDSPLDTIQEVNEINDLQSETINDLQSETMNDLQEAEDNFDEQIMSFTDEETQQTQKSHYSDIHHQQYTRLYVLLFFL